MPSDTVPFDKVDPRDLQANIKVTRQMADKLKSVSREKDDLLKDFNAKMKLLGDAEEEAEAIVKQAIERCKYQEMLKNQIEGGKIDTKKADDTNKRVKSFIKVVEKEDAPKFEPLLKKFEDAVEETKKALK